MSDTPRTDARLGYENEHHGANMLCRELERELNQAIKERDENKAGWDRCSIACYELEKKKNAEIASLQRQNQMLRDTEAMALRELEELRIENKRLMRHKPDSIFK